MENQEINSTTPNPEINQQSIAQPVPQPSAKTNKFLIPLLSVATFVLLGSTIFFAYYYFQPSDTDPVAQNTNQVLPDSSSQTPPPTEISSTNPASNPQVTTNNTTTPDANCSKTFSSQFLNLQFEYDSCAWNIEENLITPEAGVFSTITASHNSNHKVTIKANTIGMGGGYPGCASVEDVVLLDNDVVRFHMVENTGPWGDNNPRYYHYLNANTDYAIKGYEGEFGDNKFNEYFTILNPEAFPSSNMCWRGGGINPTAILEPKEGQTESYQTSKDITVHIEEELVSDQSFLSAADALVVSIFSSISN